MIILRNSRDNSIEVTTQEKVTGTPTYYVFKLTDKLTNNEVLFIPQGLLPYGSWPERYNIFDFSLGRENIDTGLIDDPTNGYINNLEEGQWVYEIYSEYGIAPTASTPITIGSFAILCESGRALIK